jgi:hypothetical protein
MTSSAASSSLRQLRLALVCDGGVSLAIYRRSSTLVIIP